MESFLSRYRNSVLLVVLVFGQVIALATQVKRVDPTNPSGDKVKLLRVWVIEALTPPGRLLVKASGDTRTFWQEYVSTRQVRRQNVELEAELNELRSERVRLYQEAQRTRQLEKLFGFKEQYVSKTIAAQVIGSSGTDASHVVYIDKGERQGIRPEMPVITPDGIVGKVREVYADSALVMLLNDQQSGVGVMLEKTRRQGIMKGSVSGQLEIHYIMADEKIEPGEKVYTSGGDRIFPKGLEVGQVTSVVPDKERDGFHVIRVRSNANLFRLEEVLVVTEVQERQPALEQQLTPAEMLAGRLPSIDKQHADAEAKLDADGKTATPPPIRPAKALAPDRFSPPEERSGVRSAAKATTETQAKPKLERVADTEKKPAESVSTQPKSPSTAEVPSPQEH